MNFQTDELVNVFERVITGEIDAGIAPNELSEDYSSKVVERFHKSKFKKERLDGVPGYEIGSTQYGKSGTEYMSNASQTQAEIQRIYGYYDGEIPVILRRIAFRLERSGIVVRPAMYKGEPAPQGRAVVWKLKDNEDSYLLKPHDDYEQTQQYEDWELSDVTKVVALNFYMSSSPTSGQLVVSNWRPTNLDRRQRGLKGTGYPYSDEDFQTRPHTIIPMETGSVAVIDGSLVHGVAVGDGNIEGRLLINIFFGVIENTVIYWA